MLNSRLQNMKESAYFDYFKSFSFNANDTLKKLQQEFKQEIEDELIFESNSILKKIKILLGSYEILIYQINDSCEFVEIPEFGTCLVKIFLQIMSIIKFLLIKFASTPHNDQQPQHSEPMHMFQRNSSTYKKKTMILTHNSQPFLNDNPPSHHLNTQLNQKQIYKHKEQSKFVVSTLSQQLSLLEIQHSENIENSKKQLKSLIEGKEKLQNIEISQNQNILTETLNSFCKKSEHLKNFVTVRQAAMVNNIKESSSGEGVLKVKDILDQNSTKKMNNASLKLQLLFKYHIQNYIKQKQSEMQSIECQVNIEETMQQLMVSQNKQVKKLNEVIKKLGDEIELQKQKNKLIENLMKSKSQQFQVKTMEYRVARIEMDNLKVKLEREKERQLEKEIARLASITPQKQPSYCDRCGEKIPSVVSKTPGALSSKRLIENDLEAESLVSNKEFGGKQSSIDIDQLQQLDDFQLVENHSKLAEKINRNRVNFQSMSTNNLSKKNLVSHFISESLQKKSQLLELCASECQITILPSKPQPQRHRQPTRLLNITSSNKKKTIFAGRPFQTQDINNLSISQSGIYGNERRKKTMLLQQKIINFSLNNTISFSFSGVVKKQPNKHKVQQKKLVEIKNYIKKVIEQLRNRDKDIVQDNQSIVQQLAQKLLQYQQLNDSKLINRRSPSEKIESILKKKKSDVSDQQQIYNSDKKDKNDRRDSPMYKTMGYDRRTTENTKRNYNNVIKNDSQMEIYKFKNSLKPAQIEKNNQLLRIQSNLSMNRSPLIGKRTSQQLSSITKFPEVSQAIEQGEIELSQAEDQNIQNNIMNSFPNGKYPQFIKFNSDQKLILTMKDLMNLFIDISTAKNFEYINLFQNDEVKISSTMKMKRNSSLNPTQQQLKKKNLANVLIKKTLQQQGINEHKKMGIHSPLGIGDREQSPKKTNYYLGQKQDMMIMMQKNENDSQSPLYTFEFVTSTLFKQLNEIRRIRSLAGHSHGLTTYETIRNFLRYPYSAVTLANDKLFIEKQKNEGRMEYLQLRRILQRVFKLHKDCSWYRKMAIFQKLSLDNNDQIKGKQNAQNGQQRLCAHVVQFFQKVGIQLFPKKQYLPLKTQAK